MLEEFREQAIASPFIEEETFEEVTPNRQGKRFLGMTPAQRLVIAVMLLMMTFLLGMLFLVVTEKVVF